MKRKDLEKIHRRDPAQVTASIVGIDNLAIAQAKIESAMSVEYWTGYYAALDDVHEQQSH
jgi:pyridoxine 5'-phosphate synthase PdxJ